MRDDKTASIAETIGRAGGRGFAEGAGEHIPRILEEQVGPFWSKLHKELPGTARESIREAINELKNAGSSVVKSVSVPAGLGAVAGAASASPDERVSGATRGAVGGMAGGMLGAAWGHGRPVAINRTLPVAGSLLGGAVSGATTRTQEREPMTTNKYAGVTLDWYDDQGATLKAMFPSIDALPDFIKEADVRPMEKLANEDFALVALDSGNVMRKFACHDPGTTAMSVIYFMEHGDKLPDAAQKLAATNLVEACQRFELSPPVVLEKLALDPRVISGLIGAGVGGAGGAAMGGEEHRLLGAGLGALGGAGLGAGGAHLFMKSRAGASVPTVTPVAPDVETFIHPGKVTSTPVTSEGLPGVVTDPKLREIDERIKAMRRKLDQDRLALELSRSAQKSGKTVLSSANVIDITGQRPTPKMKVASSNNPNDYAVVMPDGSRHYPIHTWDLVKKAEVYYQDEHGRMQPEIRRQYAVKLASRAMSMGYPLDPEILEAGAQNWAPKGHLRAAVEMRKVACQPGESRQFLDELLEKRASMEPETYAEVLRRFDVQNGLDKGWDHLVLDPWASTFSAVKTAEVVWEDGADRVTDDELVNLSTNHLKRMRQVLTESMCKEFVKDPIGIFESMPMPQKRIISRLASDHREYSDVTDNEKSA
jgi:hypothetical protein